MATSSSINLIQSKTGESSRLTSIADTLRKVSIGMVLFLVLSGLLVGGALAFIELRSTQLKDDKQQLIARISRDAAKESLLVAAKERATVLDSIMSQQNHMDKLFDLLTLLSQSGSMSSLSIDDKNKATVTINIGSIGEALTIVDTLIEQGNSRQLSQPNLMSMTLAKDGLLSLVLSFVPTL